jgi:hypothetical protein
VGGTVGGYWGWRYAFFVAGPPGILLSILFLVSVETDSANSRLATSKRQSKTNHGLVADVASLLKISSFVFATFGFASLTFAISGLAAFMPIYLSRVTDVKESVASTAFGVVACVSGVVGPFAGNALAKHLLKKRANSYLYICFVGLALSVPFGVASVLIPFFELPFSVLLCYASSFVAQTCFFSIMSPNLVMTPRVKPFMRIQSLRLTHVAGHSVQRCSRKASRNCSVSQYVCCILLQRVVLDILSDFVFRGLQLLVSHFFGDAISTGIAFDISVHVYITSLPCWHLHPAPHAPQSSSALSVTIFKTRWLLKQGMRCVSRCAGLCL